MLSENCRDFLNNLDTLGVLAFLELVRTLPIARRPIVYRDHLFSLFVASLVRLPRLNVKVKIKFVKRHKTTHIAYRYRGASYVGFESYSTTCLSFIHHIYSIASPRTAIKR